MVQPGKFAGREMFVAPPLAQTGCILPIRAWQWAESELAMGDPYPAWAVVPGTFGSWSGD